MHFGSKASLDSSTFTVSTKAPTTCRSEERTPGLVEALLTIAPFLSSFSSILFVDAVIPLTRKLKECGVFGVSSDEYLNYALSNREEWEARGEDVVASLVAACEKKFGVKSLEATDE